MRFPQAAPTLVVNLAGAVQCGWSNAVLAVKVGFPESVPSVAAAVTPTTATATTAPVDHQEHDDGDHDDGEHDTDHQSGFRSHLSPPSPGRRCDGRPSCHDIAH